jgi:dipeptidyl aminopeptidase/acylaminoacyl peptidase
LRYVSRPVSKSQKVPKQSCSTSSPFSLSTAFWIAAGLLIGFLVFPWTGAGLAQQPNKKPNFQIVFDNRYDTPNPNERYEDVDIFVMDMYGQHVRRLTADHLSHTPSLSPDGKQFAYVRDEEPFDLNGINSWSLDGVQGTLNRHRDLFRMDMDGKDVVRIASIEPDIQNLLWLPDGKRIALRSSNRRDLKVYVNHGKKLETAFDRVDTVNGMLKEYREAPPKQWHDPFLLEYYPATDNFLPIIFLHWAELVINTKEIEDLLPRMTFAPELHASLQLISMDGDPVESPVTAFDAAWSPDGNRIAYSTFSDEKNSVLSVADLKDGQLDNVHRFTAPELEAHSPVWSADSSRLAFTALWNHSQQIFLINEDGSGLILLSHDKYRSCAHPSWSPDGQWIVAECQAKNVFFARAPYIDLHGWYSSIYLFDVHKPEGEARILLNCFDNPWPGLFGLDESGSGLNNRCGAHNPSFVPVAVP